MSQGVFKFRDHDAPDPRQAEILAAYYEAAAQRLRGIILTPPGKTASAQKWNQARASALSVQVRQIQKDLKFSTADWTGTALSAGMKQGTKTAEAQAIAAGVRQIPQLTGSFHVVDRRAVEVLAKSTYADLAGAVDGMGNAAIQTLHKMAATGVTNAEVNTILAGGVIDGKPVQAIRELREALKKVHGDTVTIKDKNGDPMTFTAGYYAKMVAVTKTRQAVCQARHARLADLGMDLVTIVGKISNNFCTAYLDKVYSISGTHKKYPPLSSLPDSGPPFHPNCSKSTAPFLEDFATGAELDAADKPLPDAMMGNKDRSDLQRQFQNLQLRSQVEKTHDDVVESITGQKVVKERMTVEGRKPVKAAAAAASTTDRFADMTTFKGTDNRLPGSPGSEPIPAPPRPVTIQAPDAAPIRIPGPAQGSRFADMTTFKGTDNRLPGSPGSEPIPRKRKSKKSEGSK